MSTLKEQNFERIWLEPREGADPYIGRQWCQDNQWGEDGIEYVRADSAENENQRLRAIALDMQAGYLKATDRAEEAVKAANALQIEIDRIRRLLSAAGITDAGRNALRDGGGE